MKKKIVSLALAVCLLLVAFVGTTFAYLTDTDSAKNTMTVGSVNIAQIEQERGEDDQLVDFTDTHSIVPAVGEPKWGGTIVVGGGTQKLFDVENVIDKFVFVRNDGRSDAYVRTIVMVEDPIYPAVKKHLNANTDDYTLTEGPAVIIGGVNYECFIFTYNTELAPGEETPVSLAQIFLNAATTNEQIAAFGDTFDILCLSQAVQADGFNDPAVALNTAFGEVSQENLGIWFANVQ